MYSLAQHQAAQLNSYLASLDRDSDIESKADEMTEESILSDIMPRLSLAAQDEVRRIVLEMAEEILEREAEAVRREREDEARFERDYQDY
ncbi:hypothetical protein [Eikenella sp. Marseille-P7795]|uniref:hypothetical protein n=2 Tax=Eikenella sp. Marseille-P7795 TaxID=2866577 RepID=UPI001CE46EB3|nr:hypothetical protein [Eikenella sp. Marseille-P7795]